MGASLRLILEKERAIEVEGDLQQDLIKQMLQSVTVVPGDVLSLGKIVDSLDTQCASLHEAGEDWKRSFGEQWSVLEEVLAVALDRKQELLDEDSVRLIADANAALATLLRQLLG